MFREYFDKSWYGDQEFVLIGTRHRRLRRVYMMKLRVCCEIVLRPSLTRPIIFGNLQQYFFSSFFFSITTRVHYVW